MMRKVQNPFRIYIFFLSEIATILYKFVQLMKEDKLQECEEEFQKLPTMNLNWINTSTAQSQQNLVSIKINYYKYVYNWYLHSLINDMTSQVRIFYLPVIY